MKKYKKKKKNSKILKVYFLAEKRQKDKERPTEIVKKSRSKLSCNKFNGKPK